MKQSKIQQLYSEPKAKGFVNHLIQSYMPVSRITKVWDFTKDQSKKCNVCHQPLMSAGEVLSGLHENREAFMQGMMNKMKLETIAYLNKTEVAESDIKNNPIKTHITEGRILAFTGEKTDTCLCLQCSKDLLDMVQSGILTGDNNIVYQVNKLRRAQIFNRFNESDSLNNNEKEQVKQIAKKVEKKHTTTLGDLGILQQLKDKMEQTN